MMHICSKYLVLAFSTLSLFSCQQSITESEEDIEVKTEHSFDYDLLDDETRDTLIYLEDSEEIIEGGTGPGGTIPGVFYTQWKFINGMSIAEAEALYTHWNPNIRGLAIRGLYQHGDPDFGKKFIKSYSIKNQEFIYSHSGCSVFPNTEFEYFRFVASPKEEWTMDTIRFTRSDVVVLDSLIQIIENF